MRCARSRVRNRRRPSRRTSAVPRPNPPRLPRRLDFPTSSRRSHRGSATRRLGTRKRQLGLDGEPKQALSGKQATSSALGSCRGGPALNLEQPSFLHIAELVCMCALFVSFFATLYATFLVIRHFQNWAGRFAR